MIKRPLLVFALALCLVSGRNAATAQEKPADAKADAPAPSAAAAKPSPADAAWAEVQKTRDSVQEAQSREEAEQKLRGGLAIAEAFGKDYPADARRWDAKLLALNMKLELASVTGQNPKTAVPDAKELEAVQNAPDASASAKGEAAYLALMSKAIADVDPSKKETLLAFQKNIAAFMDKYSTLPRATEVAQMQLQLLRVAEPPDVEAVLKKLSESPNPQVADEAKMAIAQRDIQTKLKKEPVSLKFTSTDGAEVDLAKMRGKVVLVDFWASWCGPCMAEAPNVVKTYKDLHGKGFEILGISLDEDKDAMQTALKKQGMTWPQYFDGTGWENKISKPFGIDSIPAAWLIDKKGMLRETSARGEALTDSVNKLLAE